MQLLHTFARAIRPRYNGEQDVDTDSTVVQDINGTAHVCERLIASQSQLSLIFAFPHVNSPSLLRVRNGTEVLAFGPRTICRDFNKVKHEFQELVGGGWIRRGSLEWVAAKIDGSKGKKTALMKMLQADRVHYTARLKGSGLPMSKVYEAFVSLLRFMTIVVRRSVLTVDTGLRNLLQRYALLAASLDYRLPIELHAVANSGLVVELERVVLHHHRLKADNSSIDNDLVNVAISKPVVAVLKPCVPDKGFSDKRSSRHVHDGRRTVFLQPSEDNPAGDLLPADLQVEVIGISGEWAQVGGETAPQSAVGKWVRLRYAAGIEYLRPVSSPIATGWTVRVVRPEADLPLDVFAQVTKHTANVYLRLLYISVLS